jgi:hypothetical protein
MEPDDIALSRLSRIGVAASLRARLLCAAYALNRRRKGLFPRSTCSDRTLLESAIRNLEEMGHIEYTGEYGDELTTFIPFVFWLKTEGFISGRKVISYEGMRPYYYFLDEQELIEKKSKRHWIIENERRYPSNNGYMFSPKPWHRFPDYRRRYALGHLKFERPVLFIQNKFTVDFEGGPLNYLPLSALRYVFETLSVRFDIVYSRPRRMERDVGYVEDHNSFCDYPDMALARSYSGVFVLEDYCEGTGRPYNETKLEILASSHVYICCHGGGANAMACFSGSLMILFERESLEYPFAYMRGHYKHFANPAPVLLLARSHKTLRSCLQALHGVRVEAGEVWVSRAAARTMAAARA